MSVDNVITQSKIIYSLTQYIRPLLWPNPLERGTFLLMVILEVFHPTRQLARFSPPNMSCIRVNDRRYASPSFEVGKPHKITAISTIKNYFYIQFTAA